MRSSRRLAPLGLLLAAFAATRGVLVELINHPADYGHHGVAGDVHLYAHDIARVLHGGLPYRTVRIEYPPGSLPFMALPRWLVGTMTYRSGFVASMLVLDVLALLVLLRLARRHGSWWGPVAWVALLPLLGPIVYLRLDLVPAVATIWALERADRQAWESSHAWLGVGAIAKVYPLFLLPVFLAWGARRRRALVAFAVAALLPLVPLLGVLPGIWRSVVGYHSGRGVNIESLWGSGLLLSHWLTGYHIRVAHEFGAFDVLSAASGVVTKVSEAVSFAVLGGAAAFVWWAARRLGGSLLLLPATALGVLALLVGTGKVYSPQYVVWLVALAAVTVAVDRESVRLVVPVVAGIALLSQLVFPFLYHGLLHLADGPVALLAVRDLLTLSLGVGLLVRTARRARRVPLRTTTDRAPAVAADALAA